MSDLKVLSPKKQVPHLVRDDKSCEKVRQKGGELLEGGGEGVGGRRVLGLG